MLDFEFPGISGVTAALFHSLKELCTYGTRLGDLKENWFLLFSN